MERFGVPRGKRPRVQVSLDEKERAIARIRSGETKAGISRELGVPESTVRGWVKRAEQRMTRETALQPATNGYPSILAMALTKPQHTVTQAPPAASSSSPSLASQSLKLPQKRSFNGHLVPPPPVGSKPLQHLAAASHVSVPAAVPVSVPLPMPFPVPSFDSTDSELPVLGWLQIFNAGILNFTLITTAALLQARSRGLSDSLPLWQIIRDYADEAARNVAANGGNYNVKTLAPPIRPTTQVARMTSPRHRQLSSNRNSTKAPLRLHITAEDDEDCSTETEVDQ